MRTKLKVLYKELSDLTAPECAQCRAPHSCCSSEYCEMALEHARTAWPDEEPLVPTEHPRLPLMGPTGCIAPSHTRPLCTLHTCDISGLGFKKGDYRREWTNKYFKLRDEINSLELQVRKSDDTATR